MTFDQMVDIATVATLAVTAVTGLVAAYRVGRVRHMVNQQHTDQMNYQRALIRALEAHKISVPVDQSAEASAQPDR